MTAPQTCEKYQQWMDEAFAGELEAARRDEFQAHVQTCPHCRPLWQEYLEVRDAVEAWRSGSGPTELTEARILRAAAERIRQEKKARIGRGWRVLLSRPLIAAATVALIAGVGIYSQFLMKPETPPVVEQVPPGPRMQDEAPKAPEQAFQKTEEAAKPEPQPALLPPPAPAQRTRVIEEAPLKKPVSAPASQEGAADTAQEPPSGTGGGMPKPAEREAAPQAESILKYTPTEMKSLSKAPPPPREQLMRSAEKKMKAHDFQGALQDLLEAQKIEDSEEIRALIDECRSEIRLIPKND